jgi:hypothetical protein
MIARFLADYGIVFVLLALCALFSVATLDEQHPTGSTAGSQLATAIVSQTPAGATVLIVVRNTQEDTDLAAALTEYVTARGRVVLGTLSGQPFQTRAALDKIAAGGTRLDIIATVPATNVEFILENLQETRPELASTKILTPQNYTWPNFLKASNLLNITNQIVIIAIIAIGMTATPALIKSVGKNIALSSTFTVALSMTKVIHVALNIGVTFSVSLTKRVGKLLAIPLTATVALTKSVGKILLLGMTATVTLTKQVGKNIAIAVTATPALTKRVGKTLAIPLTVTVGLVADFIKFVRHEWYGRRIPPPRDTLGRKPRGT